MRQREITWQGWRVSWPDVDGGRHTFTADDVVEVENEATALRVAGVDDVRVRPVTRYRLAPLVEIAAWRKRTDFAACGGEHADARVHREAVGWYCSAHANCMRVSSHGHRTKRAAMAAAEAHLAVLGFRVKKEKRR